MKKILLPLIAAAALCASANAQDTVITYTTVDDSIAAVDNSVSQVVVKPDSIFINRNGNNVEVKVFGRDGNPSYYYSYSQEVADTDNETIVEGKSSDWGIGLPFGGKLKGKSGSGKKPLFSVTSRGIGIGMVTALDKPDIMSSKMPESIEIFWDEIIGLQWTPWRNNTAFGIGIGLDWKNYRLADKKIWTKDEEGNIGFGDYPEGCKPDFSRLKVFSITMPVTFTQGLGKGFKFSLGAVVNFNTYASLKTQYKRGDDKVSILTKGIRQNKTTIDLMAQFNFIDGIGLYVKYCPMNILDTDFGPSFKGLSAGMTFLY